LLWLPAGNILKLPASKANMCPAGEPNTLE
jgi:hypothetical protein